VRCGFHRAEDCCGGRSPLLKTSCRCSLPCAAMGTVKMLHALPPSRCASRRTEEKNATGLTGPLAAPLYSKTERGCVNCLTLFQVVERRSIAPYEIDWKRRSNERKCFRPNQAPTACWRCSTSGWRVAGRRQPIRPQAWHDRDVSRGRGSREASVLKSSAP
jgi:hypothetical protein